MRSKLCRDRARRGSGEASATRGQLLDVGTVIAALEKREIPELRAEWRQLYRAEPPHRLSRDLILRAIAYRIQEGTHGGLGIATKRRLNALAEELAAKGAAHFDAAIVLKPGTKLPRITVDWDTSQADDFRTRGVPWTMKRTTLERGRVTRSDRESLA